MKSEDDLKFINESVENTSAIQLSDYNSNYEKMSDVFNGECSNLNEINIEDDMKNIHLIELNRINAESDLKTCKESGNLTYMREVLRNINVCGLKLRVVCDDSDENSEIDLGLCVKKDDLGLIEKDPTELDVKNENLNDFTSNSNEKIKNKSNESRTNTFTSNSNEKIKNKSNKSRTNTNLSKGRRSRAKDNKKCKYCNFETPFKSDMKKHEEILHLNLNLFKCSYCSFSTARKNALKNHIIKLHEDTGVHPCHICEYKAGTVYELREHIQSVHLSHSGPKTKHMTCAYCKFMTIYKWSFNRHLEHVHGQLCRSKNDKIFKKRAIIKPEQNASITSVIRETDSSGKITFKCRICEFTAKRRRQVNDHLFSKHDIVKPYHCDRCSYTSWTRQSLIGHYSVHMKRHKCKYCPFTFDSSDLLRCHENKIHLNSVQRAEEIL